MEGILNNAVFQWRSDVCQCTTRSDIASTSSPVLTNRLPPKNRVDRRAAYSSLSSVPCSGFGALPSENIWFTAVSRKLALRTVDVRQATAAAPVRIAKHGDVDHGIEARVAQ